MTNLNDCINDIRRLVEIEPKNVAGKFIKFNEEFGEFASEVNKMLGGSHKPYDEEHLIEEGTDALQVLLSIILTICRDKNIPFQRFIDKLPEKNKKWAEKISEYTKN